MFFAAIWTTSIFQWIMISSMIFIITDIVGDNFRQRSLGPIWFTLFTSDSIKGNICDLNTFFKVVISTEAVGFAFRSVNSC